VLLACLGLTAQEDATVDGTAYTYGNRPIDKLPKSRYARPESALEFGEPECPAEGELRLHLKEAFRVGPAGIERLCVVEAREPLVNHGDLVLCLRLPDGTTAWEAPADWLGSNRRLRAFWLPVRRGVAASLALRTGEAILTEVPAPLAEGAPVVLFRVAAPAAGPLAVDAGLALLPAHHTVVTRGAPALVEVATAGGSAEPLEVVVSAVGTSAPAQPLSRLAIAPAEPPVARRLEVATAGIPGAAVALRAVASCAGQTVAQQAFVVHLADPLPEAAFGARTTDLRYLEPVKDGEQERSWDDLWRNSDRRDVVVSFPGRPYRLVFWRGTSYVPCWTLPEAWLCYEWLEAEPYFFGAVDCVEPIMDKACRHSQAEITHSTPARTVVTWRYALTDFTGKVIRDERAEEVWTLYPDGVGTRHLRGFYRDGWHETQEFILINRPGCRPSAALDPQAMTFLNTHGAVERPHWPKPGIAADDWPDLVAVVNLGAGPKPFQVAPEPPSSIKVWADPYLDKPDLFNSYPHWPVTRGMLTSWLGDPAQFNQPTHSNLVNLVNAPQESSDTVKEWVWLVGMADTPEDAVAAGACWLKPAALEEAAGVTASGFDQASRGYQLRLAQGSRSAEFALVPQAGTPVVNPAFVVAGWPGPARVSAPGADEVRIGNEGDCLVVWLRGRFSQRLALRLEPAP
jgi:hypothetical protein